MRKRTLSVLSLALAVVLLMMVPVANAGKTSPSITLSSLTIDGFATPSVLGCATTLNWSVNGLKGSPTKQWTVHAEARHRFNGGWPDMPVDTVTKADNGVAQSTPINGFIGPTEVWTVRLWIADSRGQTIDTSNAIVVEDVDCAVV